MVRRHDGEKLLCITAPREADISSKITAAIALQEITYFELWESMRCIEPVLVEGAATRISADTLDALRENVEKTRIACDDKKIL
jgi:GntR family transcriptional regulator, transcriptional repressor for pyruvate dehydrogenase complex